MKDENGRLYRLLSEKDQEIRQLKKKQDAEKALVAAGVSGMTNDSAAMKIVELSKKVRELTAEVESERTKAKQLARKCQELGKEVDNQIIIIIFNSIIIVKIVIIVIMIIIVFVFIVSMIWVLGWVTIPLSFSGP